MGARQSKRSVDISNPPKKGELENGVEEGGKLERLEEGDVNVVKATQNGNAPHAEKEASSPVTEVTKLPFLCTDFTNQSLKHKICEEEGKSGIHERHLMFHLLLT